jgi:hypothetical protein
MKTRTGWIAKLLARKGEPVDVRGPYRSQRLAARTGGALVGQKIGKLKVASVVVEKRSTVRFSDVQRAAVSHALDAVAGLFEIGGRAQRWVGFGFVDEGPAKGNEPVVVDG